MGTYQLENDPKRLWFTNHERIDEYELFSKVMDRIKQNPDIIVGERQSGPSEDIYNCFLKDKPFELIYDVDYGAGIYAENPDVISELKSWM
ncbi:MAG TPA: hypothetical protein DF613_16685 [Lachnospiraceae bacterium]|nr:hypothetical protein [Lachnospiraceae bacterium]